MVKVTNDLNNQIGMIEKIQDLYLKKDHKDFIDYAIAQITEYIDNECIIPKAPVKKSIAEYREYKLNSYIKSKEHYIKESKMPLEKLMANLYILDEIKELESN